MPLGRLVVDLLLKTGSFESDMGRASKATQKRMKEIEAAATKAGKVIGVALVAGATTAAYALKSAIDAADELNDASKKIGIPTDVLSQLQYAAKLSGLASEELQGGLVKMVKFQAAAAQGAKENVKVFDTLGISIKDASGNLRGTREVFEDFANVFSKLQDGPEKTALALKVFGKSGADLIPLLDEGGASIHKMGDELERLGGVVTPETARAADEFNDNLEALKTQVGGLALSVAADLLPDLIALVKEFRGATGTGDDLKDTAHSIAEGFRDIVGAVRGGINILQAFGNAMVGVATKMNQIGDNSPLGRFLGFDGKTQGDVSAAAFADMRRNFGEAANSFNGPAAGPATGHGNGPSRGAAGHFSGFDKPLDISGLFSPSGGGGSAKTKVDEVAQAYERMNAQMAEQIALFGKTSEVAKLTYDLEHGELANLSADKKQVLLDQAAELDILGAKERVAEQLKRIAKEQHDKDEQHHKDVQDLLADLQFETDLIGLSNEEREKMIALRSVNADAATKEGQAILESIDALQKQRKENEILVSNMDEFRNNFSDTVTDVLTGTKSIGDAFKDLADQIAQQISRIIANNLTDALFGTQGSVGGGSAGGWLSSLFGLFSGSGSSSSLLGGASGILGFASGTDYAPGGLAWVGEEGPELVQLPRGSRVYPAHESAQMGSVTVIQNIGRMDSRETGQYAANKAGRQVALSRRG